MRARYHWENVPRLKKLELLFDDGEMPPVSWQPPAPPPGMEQEEEEPEANIDAEPAPCPAEPLGEPPAAPEQSEEYTRPQRARMGVVRTVKTLVYSVGGEATVYVLNNYTQLSLPPGVGLAVGACAYGLNKYLRPENGGVL